ncbi:MAG: hypothetical protein JST54_15260 [Deltaproteobacteria bacterium]|nr:hypothetical protein [Deltaproteobacteria bacterium]
MTARNDDLRLTIWSCLLVLAAELVFAPLEGRILGARMFWADVAHAGLAAFGLLILLAQRNRPRPAAVATVFALITLAYIPNIWLTEHIAFDRGLLRDPLTTHQFVIVGIAALAPGRRRFGLTLLALLAMSAGALWLSLGGVHSAVLRSTGEPWMTLLLAAVSGALLVMRTQRNEIVHRLARAQAERDALARAARIFLSVRDRANSPLQGLEFGVALLRRRCPEETALVQRLEESSHRLRALIGILASTETWVEGELDPRVDLESEVRAASRALRDALRESSEQP